MSALANLQDLFQTHIYLRDERMLAQVQGSERVPASVRLAIYSDGYRLRLIEALSTDYPGTHGLLGDEQFDRAMRAYIHAYPSKARNLRWYGENVASFLAHAEPYAQHPLLAEMAAF